MLSELFKERNLKLCETKACQEPLPEPKEPVPEVSKGIVPVAGPSEPGKNNAVMSGSGCSSLTAMNSPGDLGWLSIFFLTLPVLIRRYR